jgi:hypothetical protein
MKTFRQVLKEHPDLHLQGYGGHARWMDEPQAGWWRIDLENTDTERQKRFAELGIWLLRVMPPTPYVYRIARHNVAHLRHLVNRVGWMHISPGELTAVLLMAGYEMKRTKTANPGYYPIFGIRNRDVEMLQGNSPHGDEDLPSP